MKYAPKLKWSKYIPHDPSPTQLAFLLAPHDECLFGGAAGGGKSDGLLMASLQWVDVPGYAGIILRKSITDLEQPGALLNRAKAWLNPWIQTGEITYVARNRTFVFPSTAELTFGFIGEFRAEEKYQGAEYCFVGFDEVTQHFEPDYLWLNHRIRRQKCDVHSTPDPNCKICRKIKTASKIPLRMRATANPGGVGHYWVKKRFGIERDDVSGRFVGTIPERPFIPSLLKDNPYLDQNEYTKRLAELDPIRRAQMLKGDWDSAEDGRFRKEWIKYYYQKGSYFVLQQSDDPRDAETYTSDQLFVFTTIDVASSEKEGIGTLTFRQDKEASWSVLSTWAITPIGDMLLLNVVRFQDESPRILEEMKNVAKFWRPQHFSIEQNGPGIVICQLAAQMGFNVKQVRTIKDKVANANVAQNKMLEGKIWFPEKAVWLEDWENEVFTWTGHRYETDDQIDTLSNACNELQLHAGHTEVVPWYMPAAHENATPFWV